MIGICRLCRTESDLQLSHIIPKFIYKWFKETSASPMRDSRNPNVRIQDGEKSYLLCSNCEELFSKWENTFSQNIFHPLHQEKREKYYYQYGEWCLKFVVSISWRVLVYGKENGLNHFSIEQMAKADEALENWREFLLSNRKSPAPFDQQLFPLSKITDHSIANLSPFINRYFLRAVDVDIACSDKRAFTYVKMGKMMLFGLIQENHPNHWKNGKIRVTHGVIGNEKYVLPFGLDKYISDRANKAANIYPSMSPNQQNKIQQYTLANEVKIGQSEIFKAMKQDFELFGDDA